MGFFMRCMWVSIPLYCESVWYICGVAECCTYSPSMSWTCQHYHGAYVCLIQQHVSTYIVRFGEDFVSGQRQQAANKHGWFDSILDRMICTKMVCRNRGETNMRETKCILAWLAIVHPSSVVQCLDCESEACWTMTTMKSLQRVG